MSSGLSTQVSTAFGSDVTVRVLSGRLTADDADDSGNITSLSKQGQVQVQRDGYFPVREDVLLRQRRLLDNVQR